MGGGPPLAALPEAGVRHPTEVTSRWQGGGQGM